MGTIKVVFTYRKWSLASWLIRWLLPRSRFAMSLASHCLVVDGAFFIEANMLYGVRRVSKFQFDLDEINIVKEVSYEVPEAEEGMLWLKSQVGKPYDWKGVLGLVWDPERSWQDESDWFCFELAAATLHHAGRKIFNCDALVTGSMLMSIRAEA